eukprot:m.89861 g.89861  ORF g.89861 m.89861 type:complete len:201 (-) comp9826_c0_seq1:349-951(-)
MTQPQDCLHTTDTRTTWDILTEALTTINTFTIPSTGFGQWAACSSHRQSDCWNTDGNGATGPDHKMGMARSSEWGDAVGTPMSMLASGMETMNVSPTRSNSIKWTPPTRTKSHVRRVSSTMSGSSSTPQATPMPAQWDDAGCATPTVSDCKSVGGWGVSTRSNLMGSPAAPTDRLPCIKMSSLYQRRANRNANAKFGQAK